MRISEFTIKPLTPLFAFFHRQPASCFLKSMEHFSRGQQGILFILALVMLGVLYLRFYDHRPSPVSVEDPREIILEILGEVRNPGIHIFQDPPTMKEAIDKAGGLREIARFESPSSELLETGTRLTLMKDSPQRIKASVGRMDASKLLVFRIPLDLNRASVEDLCLIPGIGESLAREIVAHRERRKGFLSIGELKNVKGIGEKKYQSLKDFFVLR